MKEHIVHKLNETNPCRRTTYIRTVEQLSLCVRWFDQGYDGASSTRGNSHNAPAYVRKDHTIALHVHCSAHSLNVALAESCSLTAIHNCISTVESLG
ncbi:hypothetical protein PR048_005164 [Dryococelus australis]|uniref:DUF4371 domain-containing protein n=1 Tax=Dryococelus australis TaxID=614101 RepID=A0ABQ9I9J9_9NEOP|nr:hypothetical protein PR048_005164 [Dryococelus australis]